MRAAFTRLVVQSTGEKVDKISHRHATEIAFTRSRVVKLFHGETPYLTRRRYNWLRRHGDIECSFEVVRLVGRRCAMVVMERIPDDAQMSALLVAQSDVLMYIDRVVKRLDEIRLAIGGRSLPASSVGERLVENIAKQCALLRDDVLSSCADRVLATAHSVLSNPPNVLWTPVVHGDLHASNVFLLPDRVVIIDPVFSEPRARSAPFFTELAPLYADVRVLDRSDAMEQIRRIVRNGHKSGSWSMFLLTVCLKSLVRYRVSRGLRESRPGASGQPGDEWVSSARAVSILVDNVLAEIGTASRTGRDDGD